MVTRCGFTTGCHMVSHTEQRPRFTEVNAVFARQSPRLDGYRAVHVRESIYSTISHVNFITTPREFQDITAQDLHVVHVCPVVPSWGHRDTTTAPPWCLLVAFMQVPRKNWFDMIHPWRYTLGGIFHCYQACTFLLFHFSSEAQHIHPA